MASEAPDPANRRAAIKDALTSDLGSRSLRSLSEYLARFPGADEADVAACWLAMKPGGAGDTAGIWDGEDDAGAEAGPEPYRIVNELGAGGQGTVYEAEDARLGRRVALKVLTAYGRRSGTLKRRFNLEARLASRLQHPGICTVYDIGTWDGLPWIAMQLVEGRTLADHRKLAEQRTPAFVVPVFEQAARALHAAHEKGVVHLDIKPSNIMLTPDGRPVILDFGVSLALDAGTTEGRILDVSGFGTPAYMSPEQTRGGPVDPRTDVFSLGVSLFECLASCRPFDGPTRNSLFDAIRGADLPDLRRLNPAVGRDLGRVVAMALEKDRDARYASALELADDLARILRHEPVRARPAGPFHRLKLFARRNPAAAALSAVIFTVLGAGIAAVLWAMSAAAAERERAGILADIKLLDVLVETTPDPEAPASDSANVARWLDRADAALLRLPALLEVLADVDARLPPRPGADLDLRREAIEIERVRLTGFPARVEAVRAAAGR